ncbi:MAG TPA: TadE/TadG family type IV pilus assembly protein [Gemmataceae bacterium]|jgi:Flp pilus assembly protein TadG|nr:TadE/TadG family type IV pilus assembly protein [Gemmataceae bacterium]
MRITKRAARRSGVAIVEAAFVIPVLLLLLFIIISGALMVIAADEVVGASREGARFASVRGSSYAFNTKLPAATPADIAAHVKSRAATLDPNRITCNVTWDGSNRPGQYVTVEVRYQWAGSPPFGGREFVSRSTMLVTY